MFSIVEMKNWLGNENLDQKKLVFEFWSNGYKYQMCFLVLLSKRKKIKIKLVLINCINCTQKKDVLMIMTMFHHRKCSKCKIFH